MSEEKEKLAIEAYKDVLRPSAREIGSILQNTVKVARFVFAPLDLLAAQQDRWQRFLTKVATKVEEENLVEAPAQVVGTIIEGMLYVDDESMIGEMFAQLLADSIDKTKQNVVHPAFPKIIQQLSHDEAVILYYLKRRGYIVKQQWDLRNGKIENMRTIKEDFPLISLGYPENIWMYIDHLNSLTVGGTWKTQNDEPVYSNGQQVGGITISERKLSDFGKLFAKACVPDEFPNI